MVGKGLLFVLLLIANLTCLEAYKTVVIVHGLNCGASAFNDLKTLIQQTHSGTNVILLKYYEDLQTLDPLPEQLELVVSELQKIMHENEDGIHLVCHSQGGLICLGAIEKLEGHNIDTFISLSSPIFGQYGIPRLVFDDVPILKPLLNLSREFVGPIIYDYTFQEAVSIANYWKDPRGIMQEQYEHYSTYLPYILNDPNSFLYNHSDAVSRRENVIRLNKFLLFGGPQDEVITPWQSAIFGFYDDSEFSGNMIDMQDQQMYKEDWFGLQTLDKRGDLKRFSIPGVDHDSWPTYPVVFNLYIPFLT